MVRGTLILGVLILFGCVDKPNRNVYSSPDVYVFISHTYATDSTIDRRIPKFRLANYNFWLGGDMHLNPNDSNSKLELLNYLFNIKSTRTHWAIGNHDFKKDYSVITNYTKKPSYYASFYKGLTVLVLNTNIYDTYSNCKEKKAQTEYLSNVLDTMQKSTHLIILSHNIFWEHFNKDSTEIDSYANTNHSNKYWSCFPILKAKDVLEHRLINVINKGVKVILLAGDMGQKRSAYYYRNKNGINFIANGTLSSSKYNNEKYKKAELNDSLLIFTHYPEKGTLLWQFVDIGK